MGDDEAMTGESAFRQACFIEGKTSKSFVQVGVTAGGNGQNELQPATTVVRQITQLPDVMKAQEAAVGTRIDPFCYPEISRATTTDQMLTPLCIRSKPWLMSPDTWCE